MELLQQSKEQARAPGCYGAASVFGSDSTVCQACVAFESCGATSVRTLEMIQSVVNVKDLLAKHERSRQIAIARAAAGRPPTAQKVKLFANAPVIPTQAERPVCQPALPAKVERRTAVERVKFEISEEHQAIIASIRNIKAREVATSLCENNKITECVRDLPNSINPFNQGGPHYVRITCDMLLHGGYTQARLKSRLISERGMTEGGASSHASLICAIFVKFGLIVGKDGEYTLNPALD